MIGVGIPDQSELRECPALLGKIGYVDLPRLSHNFFSSLSGNAFGKGSRMHTRGSILLVLNSKFGSKTVGFF